MKTRVARRVVEVTTEVVIMGARNRTSAVGCIVALFALTGCAANTSEEGAGRNTSREVALLIPASADATATMGVVAWQVFNLGQRTRVVGVDSANRALGEVQAAPRTHRTTGQRVIDVETILPVRALLRVTAEGEVLENSLAANEEASAWMVVAHHELGLALPADGTTYYASCGWSAAGAGFRCLGAGAACGGAAVVCGSGWLTWACGLGGAGCVAAGGMCGMSAAEAYGECFPGGSMPTTPSPGTGMMPGLSDGAEPPSAAASDPSGDGSGEAAGDGASDPWGEGSGDPSGEGSGDPSGEGSGDPWGEGSGDPWGEGSGDPSGEGSGDPSGEGSGDPYGDGWGDYGAGEGDYGAGEGDYGAGEGDYGAGEGDYGAGEGDYGGYDV